MTHLAILASHPIQYYAPLFRELAGVLDIHVFYAHRASPQDQANAGFGTSFNWDVDLTSGYPYTFLENVSARPGTDHFSGCDTPGVMDQLKRGRFDALLVTGWHLKSYLQGVLSAKRLRLPVLVRGDSHLSTPRTPLKRITKSVAYPVFLKLFDAALYVGERSSEYYRYYGFPEKRMFFSPHCVDTQWFGKQASAGSRWEFRSGIGAGDETTVVLFCGKLVEPKRVGDLIKAVASCRAEGRSLKLCVAGDGPLLQTLKDMAAAAGVPATWLGFCNQSKLPSVYAGCDLLVLPSAHETWGLVANEALACGRPVIVSDACGCHPDLTRAGSAGRSFRAGDVRDLAAAITDVIASPPDRRSISELSDLYSLESAADGVNAAMNWLSCNNRWQR